MPAYRYLVRGLVQGVGFRFFVFRQARALGLRGYVSNRPDGTVEVVAEGAEPALAELETRLGEGPPSADVAGVEREMIGPCRERGFEIR